MAARRRRDLWRNAWNSAVADVTMATLLVVIAVALAVAATLPQIPGDDAIARARALSSLHTRYGSSAGLFESLGLLTIAQSWGFRALLGLTTCCIVLRTVEIVGCMLGSSEHRGKPDLASSAPTSWVWGPTVGNTIALGSHLGAILMIAGLAITQIRGWEVTATALQGDGPIALPGRDGWVAYGEDGRVATSAGLQVRDVDWGPGVRVRAIGPEGELLQVRQRPDEALTTELGLALTRDPDLATRDALFTIPQANLIIRVAPLPLDSADTDAADRVLVQAYRSPSGDLAAEEIVRGRASVPVRDVELQLDSTPYAMVTVGRNPGRWPTIAGLVVVLAGIAAAISRQATVGRRRREVAPESSPDGAPAGAAGGGVS